MMQARFIVIDEDRGGYMHGIDKGQSLAHTAFPQTLLHLGCNVYKGPPGWDIEPEFLAETFHGSLPLQQKIMGTSPPILLFSLPVHHL
jgi:hypothetical protein